MQDIIENYETPDFEWVSQEGMALTQRTDLEIRTPIFLGGRKRNYKRGHEEAAEKLRGKLEYYYIKQSKKEKVSQH